MKISLGIHIGHDRGVCLIKDGTVMGVLSQERIDRIKYSRSSAIPFESLNVLMEYCNISLSDITCIGLSYSMVDDICILEMYKEEFYAYYKCDFIPFYFVNHHEAHAYSVYFSSGFKESLIFIADGGGDFIGNMQEAESLFTAYNGKIERVYQRLQKPAVRKMSNEINHVIPHMPSFIKNAEISIGRKYEQITYLLGFGFGEAGKTMGISSYGKSLIDYSELNLSDLNFSLTYSDLLDELYTIQQLSGKTFREFITDEKPNIAKTVQEFTEKSILSLCKKILNKFPSKNLCLAGGVFLNCLTNQKIIDECDIDSVFILPATGDDGQALGSAYYAYCKCMGIPQKFVINLPYLGIDYSNECIESALKDKNTFAQKLPDDILVKKIAELITNSKIVALHRGRTEIGPRALCHRSILANPTNPDMKDILNKRVKHREEFRPFAPTVTAEDQYKFFDLTCSSDYMLLATNVKEEYRQDLSSITHIDGTARVQAISKTSEPFIYDLLKQIEKINGYPILLNTSFNVAGEPIVETPLDAINTFFKADIDVLVIGNYIIYKKDI